MVINIKKINFFFKINLNFNLDKIEFNYLKKKKEVGYVYDPRMVNHSQLDLNYYENEIPLRISAIYQTLKQNGFISKMKLIPARLVTNNELLLFHTEDYIKKIENLKDLNRDELIRMSKLYDDLYLCSESEFCARLACGGVIELINEIILGKIISGFALVRPP
jgi:histone deacetylase 6